jgi:hypothetical protein
MTAWLQDPKNAPLMDDDYVNQKKQEYATYLKTGSTDGVTANRKLFTWQPPEERVDTWGELAKIAQATEYDSESDSYMRGVRTRKQYVSDTAKLNAAKFALRDLKLSRDIQQEYNKYLSNEVPEGQKPLPIDRYVYDKIKNEFRAPRYSDTHYQVKEDRAPRGSGIGDSKDLSLYKDILNVASANPNMGISTNPKGARQLIAGDDPEIDLGNAVFKKPDGTFTPLNSIITPNFRTNKAEVIFDPKTKQHYISADVTLDNESIEDAFKAITPVTDPFWFFDNPDVDPEYKDQFTVQGDNVTFKAYFPIQKDNSSLAATYNHAAGQTLEKSDTDAQSNVKIPNVGDEVTLPSGRKAVFNGKIWEPK